MPGLDPGIHDEPQQTQTFTLLIVSRPHGLPGHKGVHVRLRRAMPGNDSGRAGASRVDFFFNCQTAQFLLSSFRGASETSEPGIQKQARSVPLDSGFAHFVRAPE